MAEEKKDPGFVVKDKRFSTEDASSQTKSEPPDAAKTKEKDPKPHETVSDQEPEYPPVNFANFVLSLSTSALYHFGDFPDPDSGQSRKNLAAAKQTIDILDMLRDKTKGNLDESEHQLIEGVLYELKMRFVKEKS